MEFQDEHKYRTEAFYDNFKKGTILNPYDRTVCGVGYLGEGDHISAKNNIHTHEYAAWATMIKRCYMTKGKSYYGAYYHKTSVCEEWQCFETFADWYCNNFYQANSERMHLDKDILCPGNMIYASDKCLIVPQRINMLFMAKYKTSGLPTGISQADKRYRAVYNGKHLGTYDSIEDAFNVYAKSKESAIKNIANEYRTLIPKKVYDALMNYKVLLCNDKNYNAKCRTN